ncbi:MAG: hypothetical protein HY259_05435, partial [Chloroflexi bacterium]|nr:hypothetical protein [Chloroflexota bacterium]
MTANLTANHAGTEDSYWQKVKAFSHNARLYLLHIVGMDMIYGTTSVVFNLYLLA